MEPAAGKPNDMVANKDPTVSLSPPKALAVLDLAGLVDRIVPNLTFFVSPLFACGCSK